jgi:hypothetical protein
MAFRAKVLLSGNAGLKKYSEKISEIWETICRENITIFWNFVHFGARNESWVGAEDGDGVTGLWDDEFEAIGGMEGMVSGINLRYVRTRVTGGGGGGGFSSILMCRS